MRPRFASLCSGLVRRSQCVRQTRNGVLASTVCGCRRSSGLGYPAPPELRDLVRLHLLEQESTRRIKEIWEDQYRFHERYYSRTLEKDDFETLQSRLEEAPMFIWPMQVTEEQKEYVDSDDEGDSLSSSFSSSSSTTKSSDESTSDTPSEEQSSISSSSSDPSVSVEGGFFVLTSQQQSKHVFFTPTEHFNKDAEKAPPVFVITLYSDMIWNKKMGLIRAELVDPIHMDMEKCRRLCDRVIDTYLDDRRFEECVYKFNHKTDSFDSKEYLRSFDFVRDAEDQILTLKLGG